MLRKHHRLNNEKLCGMYDWLDELTEIGRYGQVGATMIAKLQEMIREAYEAGYKDAEKNMRARKRISGSSLHR